MEGTIGMFKVVIKPVEGYLQGTLFSTEANTAVRTLRHSSVLCSFYA